MTQNQDNIYWLFSSSAQTISAFVAFLVTGFAIVLNMMDNLQDKDETYEDILTQLKDKYYKNLSFLLVVTGIAIVLSLLMVYLNGETCSSKSWLFIVTVVFNLIAIFLGIMFVTSIINPSRYKKAAKKIIKDYKLETSTKDNSVDQTTFMTEFIRLEKDVRDILKEKQIYVPFGETPKMAYSFRQMIFALNQNELISGSQLEDLLQINKYRNLVFHGHQDKVDLKMLDRVKSAQSIITEIKNKMNGSA
jgi:hypothetical protein